MDHAPFAGDAGPRPSSGRAAHASMRATLVMRAGAMGLFMMTGCARTTAPATARPSVAANRVSVAVEQDFGTVYGRDACSQEAQLTGGFTCFRANGTQYHGNPLTQSGSNPTGVRPATTRLLFGYDRVLFDNWTLGARGGFVLRGGGPKPDGAEAPAFLPFHGELRAAYWFGTTPFAQTGFRAGLFVAGGIAQVDSVFRVRVEEDPTKPPPAAQPTNPAVQTLDVYKKVGTGFLGGGGTVACALGRASTLFLTLKIMQHFPSTGTVLAPEIGYEHGF
ncbi:Hypothetical protein A7982_07401 [Minicystis rosea]|nr:Hypothetical protein A7982_07401 [Minicystis rosea]